MTDGASDPATTPVAILGPTAAGKSDLALDLAEKFGGEIVNITEVIVRPFTGQVQLQSKNRDDADRPAADHERRSEREASRSSRASSKPSGRSIADDDEIPF